MSLLESIIYGLVAGISEFLPISSPAHQKLLAQLFGVQNRDPVCDLLVHFAILLALCSCCRSMFDLARRERRQQVNNRNMGARTGRIILDARFSKNASIPMLIGILVFSYIFKADTNLLFTAIFLIINGLILFISGRMMIGNKDVRSMSYFDSFLIGSFASLSAFSGISRIGCVTSASIARGASQQHALNWALFLSVPALVLHMGLDMLIIISGTVSIKFWSSLLTYLLSAVSAYFGGYYSIKLMKFLAVRTGYAGFSYYCWGTALFSFLLYLTVV